MGKPLLYGNLCPIKKLGITINSGKLGKIIPKKRFFP